MRRPMDWDLPRPDKTLNSKVVRLQGRKNEPGSLSNFVMLLHYLWLWDLLALIFNQKSCLLYFLN